MNTKEIRDEIWKRQEGVCIRCPNLISKATMHMHERVHRGRGGKISLENSVGLCYSCHLGSRGVHPEKRLRFGEHK
jgi:5-methylcytosine-specific restriction endonuclease McrA